MDNVLVFSKRFAELREKSGKSQEDLAEIFGITQQTLSRYEKGQRHPSVDFVVKAARFFNVSTDYLLGVAEVPAAEPTMKAACEFTGLSENTIAVILDYKEHPQIMSTLEALILSFDESFLEGVWRVANETYSEKFCKSEFLKYFCHRKKLNISDMDIFNFGTSCFKKLPGHGSAESMLFWAEFHQFYYGFDEKEPLRSCDIDYEKFKSSNNFLDIITGKTHFHFEELIFSEERKQEYMKKIQERIRIHDERFTKGTEASNGEHNPQTE